MEHVIWLNSPHLHQLIWSTSQLRRGFPDETEVGERGTNLWCSINEWVQGSKVHRHAKGTNTRDDGRQAEHENSLSKDNKDEIQNGIWNQNKIILVKRIRCIHDARRETIQGKLTVMTTLTWGSYWSKRQLIYSSWSRQGWAQRTIMMILDRCQVGRQRQHKLTGSSEPDN